MTNKTKSCACVILLALGSSLLAAGCGADGPFNPKPTSTQTNTQTRGAATVPAAATTPAN